jgi:DNA repair protein RadC
MNNLFIANEVKLVYKRVLAVSKAPKVLTSKEVYNLLKECFDMETMDLKISFKVMLLNTAQNVIGILNIADGGTSECPVDIKLIMQGALLSNANKIILAHNSPSGNLKSCQQTERLTNKVKQACQFMGITLLDCVILNSEGQYYSYADEGLI